MKISLYENISDNNILSKEITIIKDVQNVLLKENTSIINPTFIMSKDGINIKKCNYLYCIDMGRYYYIDNITLLKGNMLQIECSVDVLMSFKESIKDANVLILNAEFISNQYLPSAIWVNDVRQNTEIRNFENGFNENPQFVLITAGATI